MKKLWIFGDSFSASCGLDGTHPYAKWLLSNRNISNPLSYSWETLLAEDLNLKLENKAKSGCSNTEIITEVLSNINSIDKNDYIIIGWTVPTRMALPGISPLNFITISNYSHAKTIDDVYGPGTYYYDFYTNTFPDKIDKHVNYWNNVSMELSYHLEKNYNIITWSWLHDYRNIHNISEYTNGEVGDDHPSIEGHEYIYKKIKSLPWGTIFDLKIDCTLDEHLHKSTNSQKHKIII